MKKKSKIYIAGYRRLVGSAIFKNLSEKGYSNLVFRSHSVSVEKGIEKMYAWYLNE